MADHHGNVNWCYNVIDQNDQKSIHHGRGRQQGVILHKKTISAPVFLIV